MTLKRAYTLDELWNDLSLESKENELTIKSADMVSNLIVKIIQTRVEKSLTQKQVAEMAGLKQSAVARLESLTTFPRIDTLAKVAIVLGIQIDANDDISDKLVKSNVKYVQNEIEQPNVVYYNSARLVTIYG